MKDGERRNMFRTQPSMVMKYVESLDAFVKFRIFSKEGIGQVLQNIDIADRKSYVHTVLETCVASIPKAHTQEELFDHPSNECLREILYDVCIGLNPGLDIYKVVLPVHEFEADEGSPEFLTETESKQLSSRNRRDAKHLASALENRVIGQSEAIQSVAQAIARAHSGLRDPDRPVGTFLFIGQTGVGKTELAKALAEELSEGDGQDFVRIDCSEYSLPHEYAKLIGAPPGYVGHEQGGYLSSVMSQANANVVLFDEIEKADEKVHSLLLQIMDEGFVTDAKGTRIDFTNSLIIFTSNLGATESDELQHRAGFGCHSSKPISRHARLQATLEALRKQFKPEFLNRIDETILFNSLQLQDARSILNKFAGNLGERARKQGIELRISPKANAWLLEKGFSDAHGAREMRRCIQRHLETPLADALLTQEGIRGQSLTAYVKDNQIFFRTKRSTSRASSKSKVVRKKKESALKNEEEHADVTKINTKH